MTVYYSNSIATANTFTFLKLLFRWKASVYKLIWKDWLFFLLIFYTIRIIHDFLPERNQKQFENFMNYCEAYGNVPLSFILGFFVTTVMTRWWAQFQDIPYPTPLGVMVSSSLQGYDEVGRSMRRTIMRYACLSLTLIFRVLSPRIKSRFPKLNDLVKSGLLLHNEMVLLENLEQKFPGYSKSWLPIIWAANIVTKARREGRISNDFAANTIVDQLNNFRSKCTSLMSYHSIQIPLVYVQVVTIVVYCYFLTGAFADQKVNEIFGRGFDSYYAHPLLLSLEFLFYMGWLKVAEELLNPFGTDDDDFDVNSLIDRNIQMSYLIVDDMHNEHPLLLKDLYWNEIPKTLPDRTRDMFPEPDELDTDIVNYEVSARKGFFGRISVAISKHKIDDVEKGKEANNVKITDYSSLIPDPNVICDIYRNIPNVENEQSELNKEFMKHRGSKISQNSNENLDN